MANHRHVDIKGFRMCIPFSNSANLGSEKSDSNNSTGSANKMVPILVASILLTFAAAQVLTAARKWFPIDEFISIIKSNGMDNSIEKNHEKILELIVDINLYDLNRIKNIILISNSPKKLVGICEFLIKKDNFPHAQELAVLLAEAGAEKYGIANLIHRAGLEYYLGRFVQKDYKKAKHFLENPILRVVPYSQYFLGELLAAQDNPNRNLKLAEEKLEFASDRGVEEAKRRLALLRSQEELPGSELLKAR